MEGELTCRAECGQPVGVVHVQGVLDRETVSTLRSAVHECLADEPDAVVLDLSAMTTERDADLGFLAAMTRAAVAFAGVSIVLCAPSRRLRDVLAELGLNGLLPVYATLAQALAQAERSSPPRRMRRRLPADSEAGQAARDLVAEACRRWAHGGIADRAATIATELVANAVLHAGTEIVLNVAVSGHHLYVAVHDRSSQPPRLGGRDDPDVEGGSGLLVVDALAAAWGFVPTATGKVVWASVSLDADPHQPG